MGYYQPGFGYSDCDDLLCDGSCRKSQNELEREMEDVDQWYADFNKRPLDVYSEYEETPAEKQA